MKRLEPHNTNDSALRNRNPFMDSTDESFQMSQSLMIALEALDVFRVGVVVCDDLSRVFITNITADNILAVREGLEVSSLGILGTVHSSRQRLEKAVHSVARSARLAPARRRSTVLNIERAPGKRGLTLFIRSVPEALEENGSRRYLALVLIMDSTARAGSPPEDLYRLYRLTPSEARLANLIMDGASLRDCSRELGISNSMARSQLRNIFRKTRVRSQNELISLLFRSIGFARLTDPEPESPLYTSAPQELPFPSRASQR